MKRIMTIAVFTVLFVAPSFAADVRLTLDEPTLLPGTPTGLTVTVTVSVYHLDRRLRS